MQKSSAVIHKGISAPYHSLGLTPALFSRLCRGLLDICIAEALHLMWLIWTRLYMKYPFLPILVSKLEQNSEVLQKTKSLQPGKSLMLSFFVFSKLSFIFLEFPKTSKPFSLLTPFPKYISFLTSHSRVSARSDPRVAGYCYFICIF